MRALVGLAAVLLALWPAGGVAGAATEETETWSIMVHLDAAGGAAGSVEVLPGRVLRLRGWRFQPGDVVGPNWTWQAAPGKEGPRSLLVTLEAPRTAHLKVAAGAAHIEFPLAELARGGRAEAPNERASAELLPTGQHLSGSDEADQPAIARREDGTVWAAWVATEGGEDRIGLSEHTRGQWQYRGYLPRVKGSIHSLALCGAGGNRLLAVWSQECNGNWDLVNSVLSDGGWSKPARLTTGLQSDVLPQLAADRKGAAWLVWQSIEGSYSHIRLASWQAGRWSDSMLVSEWRANHWAPSVAAGPDGAVYVAWDSYAAGQYDVYLRTLREGRLSPVRRVTDGPEYEANVSLACDATGRLWIAYDRGGADWGRGAGAATLHRSRELGLRCLEGEKLTQPPVPPVEMPAAAPFAETPRLAADSRGQVWLAYRRTLRDGIFDLAAQRFDGGAWSAPLLIPDSAGRSDMQGVLAVEPEGRAWLAWASDERDTGALHGSVCTAALPEGFPAASRAAFPTIPAPAEAAVAWSPGARPATTFGGERYVAYQGDLLRRTELSACHPFRHGSLRDACRYALDAATLDFMAFTDSAPEWSGGTAGRWRLEQKTASIFSVQGRLAVLAGYACPAPGGEQGVVLLSSGAAAPSGSEGDAQAWWMSANRPDALPGIRVGETAAAPPSGEPCPALVLPFAPGEEGTGLPNPGGSPAGAPWWLRGKPRAALACGTGDAASPRLTYVWAQSLSPDSVFVALRLGRSYIGPAGIMVRFTAGGGAPAAGVRVGKGKAALRARVTAAAPIRTLELLGDGRVVHALDAGGATTAELSFAAEAGAEECAYACRVVLENGEEALTTPILVGR